MEKPAAPISTVPESMAGMMASKLRTWNSILAPSSLPTARTRSISKPETSPVWVLTNSKGGNVGSVATLMRRSANALADMPPRTAALMRTPANVLKPACASLNCICKALRGLGWELFGSRFFYTVRLNGPRVPRLQGDAASDVRKSFESALCVGLLLMTASPDCG